MVWFLPEPLDLLNQDHQIFPSLTGLTEEVLGSMRIAAVGQIVVTGRSETGGGVELGVKEVMGGGVGVEMGGRKETGGAAEGIDKEATHGLGPGWCWLRRSLYSIMTCSILSLRLEVVFLLPTSAL